jgi:hypothetical protein
VRIARRPYQLRRVEDAARAPGRLLLDGGLAQRHALLERRRRVIRETVVVLDHVDATPGEARAERGQILGREPHGLERGAGERAPCPSHEGAQTSGAEARPPEARLEGGRQRDGDELHVRVHRRVPEEHVQELGRVEGGAELGIGDGHAEAAPGILRHALDARQDLVAHEGIRHRRRRELHRLLVAERLDAGVELARLHREAVAGPHRVLHFASGCARV